MKSPKPFLNYLFVLLSFSFFSYEGIAQPNNSCTPSFSKRYSSNTFTDDAKLLVETTDSCTIVAGYTMRTPTVAALKSGTLVKFDAAGGIVKSKQIMLTTGEHNYCEGNILLRDGNHLLANRITTEPIPVNPKLLLIKHDKNLNVLWSKCYSLPFSSYKILSITEASDGNLGAFMSCNLSELAIAVFDSTGTFQWMKNYKPGFIYGETRNGKMIEDNGSFYICSSSYWNPSTTYVARINAASGSTIWSKSYANASGIVSDLSSGMEILNDNILLFGYTNHTPAGYASPSFYRTIAKISKAGVLGTVISYKVNDAPGAITINPNNEIILTGSDPYKSEHFIATLDSSLTVRHVFKSDRSLTPGTITSVLASRGASIYTVLNGVGGNGIFNFTFQKNQPSGQNCLSSPGSLLTYTENSFLSNLSLTTSAITPALINIAYQVEDYPISLALVDCQLQTNCTSLSIVGDTSICNQEIYTYNAIRNSECNSAVSWSYGNNIQLISTTDSSITFKAVAKGEVMLKASISTGCFELFDSIHLQIHEGAALMTLGNDRSLCEGKTITLHAGPGYKSYEWQNLSTDSNYVVTQPGLYYVTVTDSCNNIFTDSVTISSDQPLAFDAGNDVAKCNSDSILLVASPGFSDYNWFPAYNLSSNQSASTLAFPNVSSLYFVTAKKPNGCTVQDSIYVSVFSSPGPVSLGADKVICSGQSIILSVDDRYKTFRWQNGSALSSIIINQPGTIHITVTDSCDVSYSDTLAVFADTAGLLNAGPGKQICLGDSTIISVSSSFSNYQWLPTTGLSATNKSTVTAFPSETTRYTVSAVSANGCTRSDSIEVKVYHPAPVYLGPDTSLCEYDSAVLSVAGNFSSFRWSTGSTAGSIVVKAAGIYWVSVVDSNNCHPSDTISIIGINPAPILSLGNDTAICRGTAYNIALQGYSTHLWQNGSTNASFSIGQPGVYWVKVTDNNHCAARDTIKITGFKEPPANFLPTSDSICLGERITIKPLQHFSSYQWSNGSNKDLLEIAGPGNYWLKVKDSNGCTGSDTTIVTQKSCPPVIIFPTAFTPNKDGKNDFFKPRAFAPLEYYQLTIYNRFGQIIYQTKDVNAGWDGTFKGQQQDMGTYIWFATYKFASFTEQKQKGSLILIR